MSSQTDNIDQDLYELYGRLAFHFGADILRYIREDKSEYLTPKQITYMLNGARLERAIEKLYVAEGTGVVNSKNPKSEFNKLVRSLDGNRSR